MNKGRQFHGWQDSPGIAGALREGLLPADIAVLICDRCGSVSYNHQGSHVRCEHCDAGLDHLVDDGSGMLTTLDDLMMAEAEIKSGDFP